MIVLTAVALLVATHTVVALQPQRAQQFRRSLLSPRFLADGGDDELDGAGGEDEPHSLPEHDLEQDAQAIFKKKQVVAKNPIQKHRPSGGKMVLIYNNREIPINWDKVILFRDEPSWAAKTGTYTKKQKGTGVPDRPISLFVNHWDVTFSSKHCLDILEKRGLSVTFAIDNDGTIIQFADMQDVTWHGNHVNGKSVGVEISNAYYTKYQDYYVKNGFGKRPVVPNGAVKINGGALGEHTDFYPVQYQALYALWEAVHLGAGVPYRTPLDSSGAMAWKTVDLSSFAGFVNHFHVKNGKIDAGLDIHTMLDQLRRGPPACTKKYFQNPAHCKDDATYWEKLRHAVTGSEHECEAGSFVFNICAEGQSCCVQEKKACVGTCKVPDSPATKIGDICTADASTGRRYTAGSCPGDHKILCCSKDRLPPPPTCPWESPSTVAHEMVCMDGSRCNMQRGTKWSCCAGRGGRAKCPPSKPFMCAKPNACADNTDFCCESSCGSKGGVRPCTTTVALGGADVSEPNPKTTEDTQSNTPRTNSAADKAEQIGLLMSKKDCYARGYAGPGGYYAKLADGTTTKIASGKLICPAESSKDYCPKGKTVTWCNRFAMDLAGAIYTEAESPFAALIKAKNGKGMINAGALYDFFKADAGKTFDAISSLENAWTEINTKKRLVFFTTKGHIATGIPTPTLKERTHAGKTYKFGEVIQAGKNTALSGRAGQLYLNQAWQVEHFPDIKIYSYKKT